MRPIKLFKKGIAAIQLRQAFQSDAKRRRAFILQLLIAFTIAIITLLLGYFYPVKL